MADPWDSDTAVEARPAWEADTPVDQPQPNMGAGNKSFARVISDAIGSFVNIGQAGAGGPQAMSAATSGAMQATGRAVEAFQPVTEKMRQAAEFAAAPVEAALNVSTGLLFGSNLYLSAGLSGITQKYLLGMDVDPKEIAETIQSIGTYQPITERGQQLAGNLMLPFTKLAEAGKGGGEGVTDFATRMGASTNTAAGLGAITDATIQTLPLILFGEMVRKLGGQTVTADDMANVAKVVTETAGDPAVVERSLRGIYDKTGIGPFTIAAEAARDPALRAELLDPNVEIPKAIEPYVEGFKAPEVPETTPLTDVMEQAKQEATGTVAPQTPEFRNWFGESKVVTESGAPMVVYHGTAKSIAEFSNENGRSLAALPDAQGFYFTDNPEVAEGYGYAAAKKSDPEGRSGAVTYPVYLSLKNPEIRTGARHSTDSHAYISPAERAALEAKGFDGIIYKDPRDSYFNEYIAFKPEQIKSAIGNSGEFNPDSPLLIRSGLDPGMIAREIKGTANDIADAAKSVTNGIVDSGPGQELIKATFPMSAGVPEAQAVAQKFANAMRLARFQWQRIHEYVTEKFTPEERTKMYEAAEEQNLLLTEGKSATGKGIDRLTPDQRGVMNELHSLSDNLWKRAQDAGMVEGEGLKYWTPRMAVMIGEDGTISKPPSGAGAPAREGKNVKTTASSLKHRKHLTAEETEAAMKGALGDEATLVRDIAAMPVAMQRMSEAIAGRELVNQIKELGLATGEDIVSTDPHAPGFVTIDHPAFTTYKPEFVKGADGKVAVRMDTDGNPVMQRIPLRISKEWEGPIKAVLSSDDGKTYKLSMLIKSKAMTAIMISPMAHNMVIFGRALAYDPVAVATFRAYFTGHALAKDGALMSAAINDGMVPIGANKGSMLDITDAAKAIGKEGSWGDMNESWINLAARKVGNVLSAGLGDAMKARMDAFGDWWHHTLLWKQVGALQMYVWNDYKQYLLDRGHPPEVAGPIAAHLANRYAGAVASENSSAMVRKALNVLLFSRSFNVGNIGAVHDTAFGLPAGLRAKMFSDVGEEAGQKGLDAATAKARKGIVADLGMSMLMQAAVAAGVARLLLDQTADDIKEGYERRLQAMASNIGEHPLQPGSYNPYRILPSYENEPGKEERIDLGRQAGGEHEYLRLPTGKVVEDTVGWLMHPYDTTTKKLSPLVKGVKEAILNDKGFGVPVEDPEGGWLKHLAQGLQHIIESQIPMEQLKTAWDVMNGNGTKLDKEKLAGALTGFSVSKGNPHGPEGAVFQAQKDRIEQAKAYAMDEVKDDIKHGRDAEAYKRLSDIGLPPREIILTINAIKNPRQGMSRMQMRKFVQQANEEDQTAIENAGRQKETQ